MKFARSVWKALVAIKDGLVLLCPAALFLGLYAALALRPVAGHVREGR
jgi:protease-4